MIKFKVPIPGESLTKELGGYAWENPPKHDLLENALDEYLRELRNPDIMDDIFNMLEIGVPIDTLSQTLTLTGVMKGRHSIDIQILIKPMITEYIKSLAEIGEVEYIESSESIDSSPESIESRKNGRLALRLNAALKGLSAKKIKEDSGLALTQRVIEQLEDSDINLDAEEFEEDELSTNPKGINRPRQGLMRKDKT